VDSQVVSEFNYLIGRVQGNIVWETFQLGNYTLTNQALRESASASVVGVEADPLLSLGRASRQ
jgi:hypothetical protein